MKQTAVLLIALIGITGCGQKEAGKPPERIVNVTTATVEVQDLAVVESAVGNATGLGVAQALDPTRPRRGSVSVRLPFPEQVARRLRVGQGVRLTSFSDPGRIAQAYITEIRPALDNTTHTMEVIAELPGGREWTSPGSVRGEVVVGVHRGALLIPEQAVVLRPAGSVVYVPENDVAQERVVQTGLTRDGRVEILSGLKAGETVVVDGAGLLSHGARVRIMNPAPATGPRP